MFAQIAFFDGPRSAELVAATERAGRERYLPAVAADSGCRSEHRGTFVLRAPDGGELVLVLADSVAALEHGNEVIRASELLPDEDPALLIGPDRFAVYEVVAAYDTEYRELVSA